VRERPSANSRWVTVKIRMPVIAPYTPSARLATSFIKIVGGRGGTLV